MILAFGLHRMSNNLKMFHSFKFSFGVNEIIDTINHLQNIITFLQIKLLRIQLVKSEKISTLGGDNVYINWPILSYFKTRYLKALLADLVQQVSFLIVISNFYYGLRSLK